MPRAGEAQLPLAQKVLATCHECGEQFRLQNQSQLGAHNQGRGVYCSKRCCHRFHNRKSRQRHTLGPCPTCGKMFQSGRLDKKYCSMKCYTESPDLTEHLRALNVPRKKDHGNCPRCGKKLRKARRYCSKVCWRTYYAERFDRWVANPEKIALPQCFDEFLAAEELSCLVEGCDWKGLRLGNHVNLAHGITADEFRELAGFNVTTGLVTAAESDAMGARARELGLMDYARQFCSGTVPPPSHRKVRLEAREHAVKARAIILVERPNNPERIKSCAFCGQDVIQPTMGERLYCDTMCRSNHYYAIGMAELTCSYCGGHFMGNRRQVLSAQRGNKVCCSFVCRNKLNMATCLAARGLTALT